MKSNFYDHLIATVVKDNVYELSAEISQNRDKMIWSTIQTIGGTTYEHITVDKDKVLEALSDYVKKYEQKSDISYYDVFDDFADHYPHLVFKVNGWKRCGRPGKHKSIYIWIDDVRHYYSYGAKVLQPAEEVDTNETTVK